MLSIQTDGVIVCEDCGIKTDDFYPVVHKGERGRQVRYSCVACHEREIRREGQRVFREQQKNGERHATR